MCTASASSARLPACDAADDLDDRVATAVSASATASARRLVDARVVVFVRHAGRSTAWSGRSSTPAPSTGGGATFVRIAAASRTANATVASPTRLGSDVRLAHPPRAGGGRRSGGPRPTTSASATIATLSRRKLAVVRLPEVARARAAGRGRGIRPRAPSPRRGPTASRAKPTNALRRRDGASGQTRNASVATPPTQIDAATRCSQSASSESHDAFGSVA